MNKLINIENNDYDTSVSNEKNRTLNINNNISNNNNVNIQNNKNLEKKIY